MPTPEPTSKNPAPLIRMGQEARETRAQVRERKCLPAVSYSRPFHQIRAGYRHHAVHAHRAKLAKDRARSSVCLPTDWLAAVRWVQGPFPGTSGWLLSCSSSEGGWGRFVMNLQGSGAGGWMQFMSGTFYANVDRAIGEARARGYRVPSSVRSWSSPLGQALTAASMYQRGLSYHWVGAGC